MGEKLLGGAVGVLAVVGGMVRHVTWYLRYQVDGTPLEDSPPDEEEQKRP